MFYQHGPTSLDSNLPNNTNPNHDHNLVEDEDIDQLEDPFNEMTQNHELIGVANLYLDALFHFVNFVYWIPLISPQGEVSGRLKVSFFSYVNVLGHHINN